MWKRVTPKLTRPSNGAKGSSLRQFFSSRARLLVPMAPSVKGSSKVPRGRRAAERPLPVAVRRRRKAQAAKLCREKPGLVVLGREGVVQYPNKYGYVLVNEELSIARWQRIGKLYP